MPTACCGEYGGARNNCYRGQLLAPITSRAAADSTSTTSSTTSTTAVPGSNCSATLNGSALNRSGWAASTNAASSSADAPAKAIDGNYSTRFSTGEHQAAGLYFEVNMGSAQSFNELKMSSPNSPNDYARGFDVEVSKDGNSWTTVASCTGTRTPETVSFPDQSEQYVKVVLSAGDSHYWWSVDEFNLYGTPPPPTTTTTTAPSTTTTTAVPGSNCAAVLNGAALDRTGWTASTNAPSSGADAVSNAIDGNYSTRFSTDEHQAAGLYFQVNMGSAQSFNQLRMSVPNSPNDYALGFRRTSVPRRELVGHGRQLYGYRYARGGRLLEPNGPVRTGRPNRRRHPLVVR